MRRNQSPHSPLTWSVTILLTWATFVSVSDSKTITCEVPPVAEDQLVILTCDYGEKMYRDNSGKEIIVEHHFENGTKELIVDCYWKNGASSYTCPPRLAGKLMAQLDYAEGIGRYVTVEFPAKKDKEGLYYCKSTGSGITSAPCTLTIREPTTCRVPSVDEGQQATLTCDYGKKMFTGDSLKQIIVEHSFDNESSERILDCSRKDGASKYTCQRKKVEFQTDIPENSGRSVSVLFTANKNKEGLYYCKTPGMTSAACHFTLKRKPAPNRWKTFAIVLLCLIILCGLIVGAFLFNTRYRNRYSRYKPVVLSNAIESLISIVCSMKIMNEKLEPERADDAELLVTKAGTDFAAGVSADLPPVMARLWKDPKVQDFVRQESENLQLDSGVHFLNSLDRITAPDYKPTKEDVDKAWVKVADAGKTSFNFQAVHQRVLRQRNSTAEGAASDLARETDHLLSGSEKTQPLPGLTWTRGHKQDVDKGQQEGVWLENV